VWCANGSIASFATGADLVGKVYLARKKPKQELKSEI